MELHDQFQLQQPDVGVQLQGDKSFYQRPLVQEPVPRELCRRVDLLFEGRPVTEPDACRDPYLEGTLDDRVPAERTP